jgi:hypothetical protein
MGKTAHFNTQVKVCNNLKHSLRGMKGYGDMHKTLNPILYAWEFATSKPLFVLPGLWDRNRGGGGRLARRG